MGEGARHFLGVERSLTGRAWVSRLADDRLALAIAQREGLPEIVARVLAGRGVLPEDCAAYLAPSLRTLLPDPSALTDMDKAAARIARAVVEGEPVAVFGDYDVDGATSSALLQRYFRAIGADLRIVTIAQRLAPRRPDLALKLYRAHRQKFTPVYMSLLARALGPSRVAEAREIAREAVALAPKLAGLPQISALLAAQGRIGEAEAMAPLAPPRRT